jgi:hypothetical protein
MSSIFPQGTIRLSDVVSALSVALDLTEGQPMGHAIRTCILGVRLADELAIAPRAAFRPLLRPAAQRFRLQ